MDICNLAFLVHLNLATLVFILAMANDYRSEGRPSFFKNANNFFKTFILKFF